MSAHESTDHAGQVGAAALDAQTVQTLHDQVAWLARSYASTPPLVFYQQALQVRALLYRMIERTLRPAQLADLYVMAGQVCGLLAASTFDLGYYPAATEQARAAFTYGEVAGHNGVRAYARGLQAVIAYWDKRPRDAVDLATSAAPFAAGGTSGVRVACVQARAWAMLGAEQETRDSIAAATRFRDAGPIATDGDGDGDDMYDAIGGEFGFSPARERNWYGTALLTIHDASGSAEHNRQALALLSEAPDDDQSHLEPGLEAYVRVDLATATVRDGDLDAAAEAFDPLWAIPDTERRSALTGRVATLSAELTGPGWRHDTRARQLRDRLETYTAAAALARALPAGPAGI